MNMKNCKKCSDNMSALKLILIITGSIIAAAGILCLLMQLCKKKHHKKVCGCCDDECDTIDSWDIDEDVLSELELDDDEDCGCTECSNPECATCQGISEPDESETDKASDDAEQQ